MIQLVLNSFVRPREVIAVVLRFPINQRELIIAAGLISCLLSICTGVIATLNTDHGMLRMQSSNPISDAIFTFLMILATTLLVERIGVAFGGKGNRLDAMKAVVWFNWVTALPTLLLVGLVFMDKGLAWLLSYIIVGVQLVVFAAFVQVVHQFNSLLKTLLGVIGSAILFGFILQSAMYFLGLLPTT